VLANYLRSWFTNNNTRFALDIIVQRCRQKRFNNYCMSETNYQKVFLR